LDRLTRLVRRFTVEQQQVPKDLAELVTLKYLGTVPPAPVGKRFVIDRRKAEVRLELKEVNQQGSNTEPNSSLRSRIVSNPGEAST
jgi:hypothetical protein